MKISKKFSRRFFIFSSLSMGFGFTGLTNKEKSKQMQLNDKNHNNMFAHPSPYKNRILLMNSRDNVAIALEDLPKGTSISVNNLTVILSEAIPVKHKFTLSDIPVGGTIYLYGVTVGKAVKVIPKGNTITTENIVNATSEIERNLKRRFEWTPPEIKAFKNKGFMGYHRTDGRVGTANHWLVIPMVFCENRNMEVIKDAMLTELGYQPLSPYRQLTKKIISLYKQGATASEIEKAGNLKIETLNSEPKLFRNVSGIQFLTHTGGCGGTRQDSEALCELFASYITHPNVAGVTVVSLGCQHAQLPTLQQAIKKRDPNFSKPYFEFDQQKTGTEEELIEQAIHSIFTGLIHANKTERKPAPLSKLCIGLKCGGSDGFSGISANPAIGHVSDLIVALGGSSILSEFPELSGVEQDLYNRCINQAHADKFLDLMQDYNAKAKAVGSGFEMNPSPGNIRDGLITDAMKSAGAAKKGGTSPVAGVSDYLEKAEGPGLHLLCAPGNDVEAMTAEVASGANLILFTTGLGTPTGNPIVPVIKISTNTTVYQKMPDIIDINSGTIIDGEETIEQNGERIMNYLIDVASGVNEPAALRNGQSDFIPWKRGVSL